ncbi:hypothetical protein B0H14DRAFT_2577736 [Mycena olivaceomarginata]|nr:hypothetical protein B0H14DRAFT_2577736 [Mycena olivaceomarginata]
MTLPAASMALPAYPLAFFLSFGHIQNNCQPEQLGRLSQKFRASVRLLGAAASSSTAPSAVRPAISNAAQHSTAPVQLPSTSTVISELNKDLATVALDNLSNSTECIFDESLGDEEDEGDNSVNTNIAQKEMEHLEAKTLSENHQWLKTTLPQIVNDTTGRLALLQGCSIFYIWLPHYLPGHPDSFKCECGVKLILHGYNNSPIAHRVSMLAVQDYFLLTNRFLCPLCHVNDKGNNPWIICQLPEFVQQAFPVCLSACGGLDMSALDVMKATFAGHFGADPFSKMVHELKMLHHDRLETMQYFKSMFTAWFSIHRGLIDRVMLSLLVTIIKADHVYKSCLPGGEPINTAMYSIMNSNEEV